MQVFNNHNDNNNANYNDNANHNDQESPLSPYNLPPVLYLQLLDNVFELYLRKGILAVFMKTLFPNEYSHMKLPPYFTQLYSVAETSFLQSLVPEQNHRVNIERDYDLFLFNAALPQEYGGTFLLDMVDRMVRIDYTIRYAMDYDNVMLGRMSMALQVHIDTVNDKKASTKFHLQFEDVFQMMLRYIQNKYHVLNVKIHLNETTTDNQMLIKEKLRRQFTTFASFVLLFT